MGYLRSPVPLREKFSGLCASTCTVAEKWDSAPPGLFFVTRTVVKGFLICFHSTANIVSEDLHVAAYKVGKAFCDLEWR